MATFIFLYYIYRIIEMQILFNNRVIEIQTIFK